MPTVMTGLPSFNKNSIHKELDQKVSDILPHAKAKNTREAYKSDWIHFGEWCHSYSLGKLPADPETIAYYLSDIMGSYSVSTLKRRLSAISMIHKLAGYDSPTLSEKVKQLLEGIERIKKESKTQKLPLLTRHLVLICNSLTESTRDIRDKAILLLGFAGGFRRSELVNLDCDNIEFRDEGVAITVSSSKTDQKGKGVETGIMYGSNKMTCPVVALREWLKESRVNRGSIFRGIDRHGNISESRLSAKSVALIVKKHVREIGLDPSEYSGHSLRSGTVTQAALNDVSLLSIMDQTGHKSERVVREYYRKANIFKNNASSSLGL